MVFVNEKGRGPGKGFNINIPLPENIEGEYYETILQGALNRIHLFKPGFLVVALGLDTASEDPTGSWSPQARDFESIGKLIGSLLLPILVVQEGGYDTRVIGINARSFFTGLWAGAYSLQNG